MLPFHLSLGSELNVPLQGLPDLPAFRLLFLSCQAEIPVGGICDAATVLTLSRKLRFREVCPCFCTPFL